MAGPDLVIAGAARSGTSFLASVLGDHPSIDAGSVKEPNYFSRELNRGQEWYDSLYEPQRTGLVRLDASMSYTFMHFPHALSELVRASPHVLVVYVVREPIARALSHFQLHRDYFANEAASTFVEAATPESVYLGASRYEHWLAELARLLPPDQTLLVPFSVVTGQTALLTSIIYDRLGIRGDDAPVEGAAAHRNEVVQFRSALARRLRRAVRRSGAYPWLRSRIGSERMRWLRRRLTKPIQNESLAEALDQCSPEQLVQLDDVHRTARAAAMRCLEEQDARLGLDWAVVWGESCPTHLLGSTGRGKPA